jgi:hypothetical protein
MDENHNDLLFYSNRVELTATGFDLKMNFQQLDGKDTKSQKEIILSWPHAKQLQAVLAVKIADYEKMYSPIVTDPNPAVIKEMKDSGKIK